MRRGPFGRTIGEFDEFFKCLKKSVGGQIHVVFARINTSRRTSGSCHLLSDKLWQYRRAFNRCFYRTARLVHGVPIACGQYGLEHNNNPERRNQDIK